MTTPGQPSAEHFHPFYIPPGTRVGGYLIRGALGRGSAQMAYLAESSDGGEVALKVSLFPMGEEGSEDRRRHERFLRQVDLFRALRGTEGVADIFGYGTFPGESEAGYAYLVQEWVPGSVNILDWSRKEPHPLKAIIEGWGVLAMACARMTHVKICHRDLTPENILVRPDGVPRIVDFNTAKFVGGPPLTTDAPGHWPGTRLYYSPEVCRMLQTGSNLVHHLPFHCFPPMDLHALGVILYQVLTGQYPFGEGASYPELLERIIHDVPKRPRKLNPEVPWGLDKVTMKLLRKDPRRRYESGDELAGDLRALLGTRDDWERPFQTPAKERRSASSRSRTRRTTTVPPPPTPTDGSVALAVNPWAIVVARPSPLVLLPRPEPKPWRAVPRRLALLLAAVLTLAAVAAWLSLGQYAAPDSSTERGTTLRSKARTKIVVTASAALACVGLTGNVRTGDMKWLESCPPESRKAVHELLIAHDQGSGYILPGPSVIIQPYHDGLEVKDGPVEVAVTLPATPKGYEAFLYGEIRTGTDGAVIHFKKMRLFQKGDPRRGSPSGPERDICAVGVALNHSFEPGGFPKAEPPFSPDYKPHDGFMLVTNEQLRIVLAD